LRYLTGFFRFWYDFLVGDSWQIALGVVLVIGVTRVLLLTLPHHLAGLIETAFFLGLLAVLCGVLLSEHR
jgi:hypothetical protein